MSSGSSHSGQGGLLYDAALIIEIVQLCQRVHDPHDPVEGKQQLLEGLTKLADGDYGLCAVCANGDFNKPLATLSVMSQANSRGKSKVTFRRPSDAITNDLLDTARQANHHPRRKKEKTSARHIVS